MLVVATCADINVYLTYHRTRYIKKSIDICNQLQSTFPNDHCQIGAHMFVCVRVRVYCICAYVRVCLFLCACVRA